MTTTTSYGTWQNYDRWSVSVEQMVEQALPDDVDDFDVDAIAAEHRAHINTALPVGVSLCGDEFIGPWPADPLADEHIMSAIDAADMVFWAVVERHAKPVV